MNLGSCGKLLEVEEPQIPDLRPQSIWPQLLCNSFSEPPDPLLRILWLPVKLQRLFIFALSTKI